MRPWLLALIIVGTLAVGFFVGWYSNKMKAQRAADALLAPKKLDVVVERNTSNGSLRVVDSKAA